MGYVNPEEYRKFVELCTTSNRIQKFCEQFNSGSHRDQLELIMQGMVKKLVGSSKRIVSKGTEGKDYFSRWGSDGEYGLTADGLAEAFGRRTQKGTVKLRKTNFITSNYEPGGGYTYSVDKKVLEFLKTCEKNAIVKDKDRLGELIAFAEKVNTIAVNNLKVVKQVAFEAVLVHLPGHRELDLSQEDFTKNVKMLTLRGSCEYGYDSDVVDFDNILHFDTPTWDEFQAVSLPKTYSMLMNALREFERELKVEYERHFKACNDLVQEKGEYIVLKEL